MKEGFDKRQIEFKIDASRCWLRVGDPVTPDTLTILIQMYHICPVLKTSL